MTIDDFAYEYDSLNGTRQSMGLNKLFQTILEDMDAHYGLIEEILEIAVAYEADDGFGTEGLNV